MKLPESTATIRSAGSRSSRAIVRERGSIRSPSLVSSNGTSRQRTPAASRSRRAAERYPVPASSAGSPTASRQRRTRLTLQQRRHRRRGERHVADDAALHRPVQADGRLVAVDLNHRSSRPIRLPCRVVHMPSEQPHADEHVRGADQLGGQRRREPAADVQVPRAAAEQPLGRGRGRQQRAAAVGQLLQLLPGGRAPSAAAGHEHRPGRVRQRGARSAASAGGGRVRPGDAQVRVTGPGALRPPGHPAAAPGRPCAARRARSGRPGPCRRPRTRPTAAGPMSRRSPAVMAATSIRKFEVTAPQLTSAASTSSGVRAFAASVIPVSAFVSPGP